jgi:hypothetical protein
MARQKSDRKAIENMEKILQKYGGRRPEYITMFLADRLNSLTRVLIGLTVTLAILTVIHIYLLVR